MYNAPDDHLPTPAVFAFLATSLGDMADRVKRLEDHAEPMIGASPRRACTAASLRGGVLHRSLAGTLRLAALREKLLQDPSSGAGQNRVPTDGPKSSGTLDLFDSGDEHAPPDRSDLPLTFRDGRPA